MEKPKLNFTINGARNMEVMAGQEASFKGQPLRLLNGGDTLTVTSDYGDMLFQNVRTPFGMISLSKYNIVREAEISAKAPDSAIEFMFMMQGHASFKMEGLKRINMAKHDCNLIYYPYVDNKVRFPAGTRIMTVDLHIDPGYLVELAPYFSQLGVFLEKVHKNQAAGFFNLPVSIPIEVVSIIANLFTETGTFMGQELYLKTKILEWIALPIKLPVAHAKLKIRLTRADRENIRGVFEAMLAFPGDPLTIPEMAKKAGMNAYKFQNGFKILFHHAPHQMLVESRMKKAQELLADINNSTSDVAYLVGYQDLAGFSKAFKKFFGYPPSVFRPNNKNDG